MYKTKIDIPDNTRKAAIALLQARLADAIDLAAQMKQAHWNVKGPSFIALHELFDQIHGEAVGYVDQLAERITTLGGTAEGTVRAAAGRSTLKEYPLDIVEGAAHVDAVSSALASFGKLVRKAIDASSDMGDEGTADIFTEVSRGIDKSLWFVEAHAQTDK